MTDIDRIGRVLELLSEAQVRVGLGTVDGGSKAYVLVDLALRHLRDELADRMLEEAAAEIMALVDIHGLIDDVAGDDRRLGFE